jgi:diguanylate cyclase (GGDEF)-like protein
MAWFSTTEEQPMDRSLWLVAADDRDHAAESRDERAEASDVASDARDDRATVRDQRAESNSGDGSDADLEGIADRAAAVLDRRGGRADRIQASDDRLAAASDRASARADREVSSIDELTRAHRRDAGTIELTREIARAKRTEHRYVLAFVDVDHLKATNDSLGHAAGDQLLRRTVASIRAHLRSYDLIVRYGGDEFVCGLTDMTTADAAERFALVNAHLRDAEQNSISVGITELRDDDVLEDLVIRADEAMYAQRQQLRGGRSSMA